MLDEKDLLAIAQLMDMKLTQQKNEILQETAQMMEQQKTEILQETTQMMEQQKSEILQETTQMMDQKIGASERRMMVMMESYFDPKFQLLSEQITGQMQGKASAEVVQDLDDRVTELEEDVLQLKKAQ